MGSGRGPALGYCSYSARMYNRIVWLDWRWALREAGALYIVLRDPAQTSVKAALRACGRGRQNRTCYTQMPAGGAPFMERGCITGVCGLLGDMALREAGALYTVGRGPCADVGEGGASRLGRRGRWNQSCHAQMPVKGTVFMERGCTTGLYGWLGGAAFCEAGARWVIGGVLH